MAVSIMSRPTPKESNPVMYKVTCTSCGCKLSYTEYDIRYGCGYHQPEKFVVCPNCTVAVSTERAEPFSKTDYANMDKR